MRRLPAIFATCLLMALALAPQAAGSWRRYGKDLANSRDGGSGGPSVADAPALARLWTFPSSDGDFTGTPVVAHRTVVAGSGGGTVFALAAKSGIRRWSHDFNQPINGSAAIAGRRVYVPLAKPSHPRLAALRLTDGKVLWTRTLDRQPDADTFGSPVVWHGTAYIGVSALAGELSDPNVHVRGALVALDARSGHRLWKRYTVPRGHDGGAVWSTPAIDRSTGLLYVGTGNAYHAPATRHTDSILALDPATGRIERHYQATAGDVWNATGNVAKGPDADFGASPNLIEGAGGGKLVGEGQKSGTYWALRRRNLHPVWNTTIGPGSQAGGILGSTAYDGKRIYGPDTTGGEIWALNRDGSPAWVSSDGDPVHFGAVSVANGVVYSTSSLGFLTARDAATGLVLAKLPLGAPSWTGISISGGRVYTGTGTQQGSGSLEAFGASG
jgi:polyvinyl alcohol dehydrogenase (cytochrome)